MFLKEFCHASRHRVTARRSYLAAVLVAVWWQVHGAHKSEYLVADETRAELPSCATDATKLNVNNNNNNNAGSGKRVGFASCI